MIPQDKIAFPFNWVNKIGGATSKLGLNYPSLKADDILQRASDLSGLTDFGDNSYMEGLEALMYSGREDNLNFIGQVVVQSSAVRYAQARLEWVEHKKKIPAAFKSNLKPPLIVVGAPRSGTTIMHRMLAADPENQAIPMWRLMNPFPPTKGKDNRLSSTNQTMKWVGKLTPQLALKHEVSSEKPEECIMVQGMSFNSLVFYASSPVYSYIEWYKSADRFKMYEEYASVLRWYQYQDSRRLAMKAPTHAENLSELLKAVPNALIVQTHRDPVEVVNSANSLFHTLFSYQMKSYDIKKMVENNLNYLEFLYNKNRKKREALNHSICDVDYNELVKDPIGTTKKVYAHFGLEWTEDYELSLKQFMCQNPKDKHGKHHYIPEDFGLTNDAIRERFQEYDFFL